MQVKVNYKQRAVSDNKLCRAHKIVDTQPKGCGFHLMSSQTTIYSSLEVAEAAMRKAGNTRYKRCRHCWDNKIVDL